MAEGREVKLRGRGGVEGILLLAGSAVSSLLAVVVVVVVVVLVGGAVSGGTISGGAVAAGAGSAALALLTVLRLLSNDFGDGDEVLRLLLLLRLRGGRGSGGRGLLGGLVPVGLDDAGLSGSQTEGGLELLLLLGLLGLEGSNGLSLGLSRVNDIEKKENQLIFL